MITSPSGKVYIGQAKDIHKRWNSYKLFHCKSQRKLYYSFKKYGIENHEFEILSECHENELLNLEIDFIKFFDTFDTIYGLNLTSGGQGGQLSKESIEKRIKSNTGKKHTQESKERMRLTKLGKKITKEHKEKIRKAMIGRKFSEETIIRMKKSAGKHLKGKKQSPEHIEKGRQSRLGKKRPQSVIDMLRKRVPTQKHREAVSRAIKAYWDKRRKNGEANLSEEEKIQRSITSKKMWERRKALGLITKRGDQRKKRKIVSEETKQIYKMIRKKEKEHPDYNSEENKRKRSERQKKAAKTKMENIAKRIEQERLTMIF